MARVLVGVATMVVLGVGAGSAQAETVNVPLNCGPIAKEGWTGWSLCTTGEYELTGLDTDDVNVTCPADQPYAEVEDLPWLFDVIAQYDTDDENPHLWFRAYNANPFRGGKVSSRVMCTNSSWLPEWSVSLIDYHFDKLGIGNWDVLNWGAGD